MNDDIEKKNNNVNDNSVNDDSVFEEDPMELIAELVLVTMTNKRNSVEFIGQEYFNIEYPEKDTDGLSDVREYMTDSNITHLKIHYDESMIRIVYCDKDNQIFRKKYQKDVLLKKLKEKYKK